MPSAAEYGPLIAAVVLVALVVAVVILRRLRRGPDDCQTCGYSLRGLQSRTCPECGHVNPAAAERPQSSLDRRARIVRASIFLVVALGAIPAFWILESRLPLRTLWTFNGRIAAQVGTQIQMIQTKGEGAEWSRQRDTASLGGEPTELTFVAVGATDLPPIVLVRTTPSEPWTLANGSPIATDTVPRWVEQAMPAASAKARDSAVEAMHAFLKLGWNDGSLAMFCDRAVELSAQDASLCTPIVSGIDSRDTSSQSIRVGFFLAVGVLTLLAMALLLRSR